MSRRRVYELLEVASPEDRASAAVDRILLALILGNVVAMILESEAKVLAAAGGFLRAFEAFSVVVFTVEYVLRLWSATAAGFSPVAGRIRFALRPLILIDLLAILPFYLPMLGFDLRVLRIVRIFRVFRILKLARYSTALQTFGRVLLRTKEQLVLTLGFGSVLLVISASLMHFAEGEAQPQHFGSILRSLWWGVVTLTTVGYGDVYPVTVLGRVLGALIAVLGIGMFAVPAGILGAAFVAEAEERGRRA